MKRIRRKTKKNMNNNNKKKLLITASTFPRWAEDTEPRFILDLAKELQKDFQVTVLVPMAIGAKKKEVLEGVEVIRYHYFPIYKWETLCYPGAIVPRIKEKKSRILLVPFLFLGLWIALKTNLHKYDFVHVNWLIPQGIVQCCFNKPYVITGLGGDVTSLNKGWIYKRKRKCLCKARAITVVSNSLKYQIEKIYSGANPTVITMGVDTKEYGKKNRVYNYFNDTNKKKVLFVGRLVEKKGLKYLIQAMAGIDADLIVVGDGPMREELVELSKDYKVNTQFLGAKTKNELKIIYASADIFVVPSVAAEDGDMEGLPTVIIEAMASELPIIAYNTGGIADIIIDGKNGFLLNERDVEGLKEKIYDLINNYELCSYISLQAKHTSKKYDYEKIGEKYRKVMERAFEQRA